MANPSNYAMAKASSVSGMFNGKSTDPYLQKIMQCAQGGLVTADYFSSDNALAQQLGQMTTDPSGGGNTWQSQKMENGLTGYWATTQQGSDTYVITFQPSGITLDGDGNVVYDGTSFTNNAGTTFHGIGNAYSAVTLNSNIISEAVYTIGAIEGIPAAGLIFANLSIIYDNLVESATKQVTNAMGKLIKNPDGGLSIEETAATAEEEAGTEIAADTGCEVLLAGASLGPVGAAIALTLVIFGFAEILHPSYQQLRIWNLTSSDITFSTTFLEGGLQSGLVTQDPATGATTWNDLKAVAFNQPSPLSGANPINNFFYGDYSLNSNAETNGITWGLDMTLTATGTDCRVMFDIPLVGANSSACGFNQTSTSLSDWVSNNEGKTSSTSIQATSADNRYTVTVVYDQLKGEQPLPSYTGSTSNGYFYRTAIILQEPGIFSP